MASTFKTFVSDDIANTRTLLHEAIPITGSIVNGTTYTTAGEETNVKTYGHGMFQSVYDYPYTSSSANHIFDITYGSHPDEGSVFESTSNPFYSKRNNVYNQMAQVLVGHKVNGSIRKFDRDGDLTDGAKYNSLFFFNFARLLGKDEIKKGTFSMKLGMTAAYGTRNNGAKTVTITDSGNQNDYKVNSPAGEYSILRISEQVGAPLHGNVPLNTPCGLIFYQAGVVAIAMRIFDINNGSTDGSDGYLASNTQMNAGGENIGSMLSDDVTTTTTDDICKAFRERIMDIQFSNTTELNSTIYFCRVGHNDFNYSSNPTYLEQSKIRVKDKTTDAPVSYITTVGLYSATNELLAVAKLSEPLRKDPTNDMTLRVRLDY